MKLHEFGARLLYGHKVVVRLHGKKLRRKLRKENVWRFRADFQPDGDVLLDGKSIGRWWYQSPCGFAWGREDEENDSSTHTGQRQVPRSIVKPFRLDDVIELRRREVRILQYIEAHVSPKLDVVEDQLRALFTEDDGCGTVKLFSASGRVVEITVNKNEVSYYDHYSAPEFGSASEAIADIGHFEHGDLGREYLRLREWHSQWWERLRFVRGLLYDVIRSKLSAVPRQRYRQEVLAEVRVGSATLYWLRSRDGWELVGTDDPSAPSLSDLHKLTMETGVTNG